MSHQLTPLTPFNEDVDISNVIVYTVYPGGRKVDLASVGRALYSLSLRKLRQESTGSTGVVNKIMALLLQAGCLGNDRALQQWCRSGEAGQ